MKVNNPKLHLPANLANASSNTSIHLDGRKEAVKNGNTKKQCFWVELEFLVEMRQPRNNAHSLFTKTRICSNLTSQHQTNSFTI